ncbi:MULTISPECIES: hypothetical protein, partial [Archaea][Bacteria]|uniref:hypothetical protein n=1 Tax=Bacteria TaxID=2 RepID=UPI003863A758
IALDTLMNTFMDYVQALRDRKYLKKSCYGKATALAFEMLSSWFTGQIAYIQDFVSGLYEEFASPKAPKLS